MPGRVTSHPMGERSAPRAFGHNGSNTCLAWADPGRRLAVAYLTSHLPAGNDRARHLSAVSDAILAGPASLTMSSRKADTAAQRDQE